MSVRYAAVLDASALLAYLQGELGADVVATALIQGSVMSAINWGNPL
jgi:ribonuclease VapC